MNPKVAILLPTYNGGKYLAEQLDSLFAQSYQNFVIVIRDDGSTDDTEQVIQTFQEKYPHQIHLPDCEQGNLGALGNFTRLMQYTLDYKQVLGLESAYMLFCDQDDIWRNNKIELVLNCMLALEKKLPTTALLVHSDLHVVSQERALIAPSYIEYQGLQPARNRFSQLLISNLVTGCTAFINEALARKALPIPAAAIMHDWWLALVAAAFGEMVLIEEKLVDYRQHGSNTIGAKEYIRPTSTGKSIGEKIALHNATNPHLDEVAKQAEAFFQQYAKQLGKAQKLSLKLCAAMGMRAGISQKILYRMVRRL